MVVVIGGSNVSGPSISPALGDAVSCVDQRSEPSIDLSAMSITRFGPVAQSEVWLRKSAAWQ